MGGYGAAAEATAVALASDTGTRSLGTKDASGLGTQGAR